MSLSQEIEFQKVETPSLEYNPDFMRLAIEYSTHGLDAKTGKGPFGAVITYNGKLVCAVSNEVRKSNDPTCHAEVYAIRKACEMLSTYDLTGCVLYASSEPCPMCLSASIWANIAKVYYANSAAEVGRAGFRDDNIYAFIRGNKTPIKMTLEHHPDKQAFEAIKEYCEKNVIY